MPAAPLRACVLVFAGQDPGGGAGISADIEAIGAMGAHALPVITALTVQDNDRVYAVHPVEPFILQQQAEVLAEKMRIAAVKIGIVGSVANAQAIAATIADLRKRDPDLPVVLDPVLASGHGDMLTRDDAVQAIAPLVPLATLILPNLPEAHALCGGHDAHPQADRLLSRGAANVLIKGGHGEGEQVLNHWFALGEQASWSWPRLPGEFHGTGCTLASAAAALLAQGRPMREALEQAQHYVQGTLAASYAIAEGQRIPARTSTFMESNT